MTAALAIAAFLAALALTGLLASGRVPLAVLDHPNERSLHARPTPRGGGLAFAPPILAAGAWLGLREPAGEALAWAGAAAALVVVVSFLDDRRRLRRAPRFLAHLAAAALLAAGGLVPPALLLPGWAVPLPLAAGALFVLLLVAWLTNLYNFMDGMDGFAGGMAVIGFGAFALLGWQAGDPIFATLSLVVAASVAGFLFYNFPPARIFMGDVGSSLLGFLVAALGLWAERDGLFPLWVTLLVFSPFIVDATVTLALRIARGEPFLEAHRQHYYQRLVRLGWGHRRTVLHEYALMLACAGSALLAVRLPPPGQWALLCAWGIAYTLLMRHVSVLERRGRGDAGRPAL